MNCQKTGNPSFSILTMFGADEPLSFVIVAEKEPKFRGSIPHECAHCTYHLLAVISVGDKVCFLEAKVGGWVVLPVSRPPPPSPSVKLRLPITSDHFSTEMPQKIPRSFDQRIYDIFNMTYNNYLMIALVCAHLNDIY